jgi:hypothetical protein
MERPSRVGRAVRKREKDSLLDFKLACGGKGFG